MKKETKTAQQVRGDMVAGFTLAEVLITLGVIGIVAALTMPALIANYQKKVLETRIKKFYSVINQAVNSKIADDSDMDTTMITTALNAAEIESFVKANYLPYLKTVKTEILPQGVALALPDGSGMYVYTRNGSSGLYPQVIWCVDYKECLIFNQGSAAAVPTFTENDGKKNFMFASDGATDIGYEQTQADAAGKEIREYILELANDRKTSSSNGLRSSCAILMQVDGWEIKDDNPCF